MRIRVAALVLLLLLPACGARTAEPPAEAAAAGDGERAVRSDLETMVVPQEDIGGLPRRLRVSPDSGWKDNRVEAESSLDPEDTAASLREAGRITGYDLVYYDPTRVALRAGSGVDSIMTWVDLFSSESAASAALRDRIDHSLARAGTSPRQGVTFDEVTPFDLRMPVEAYGLRESAVFGGDRIFRTLFAFRRGNVVAGGMVVRADSGDATAEAERMAGILHSRIQIGLHGGSNGEPVLVPEDGVPLDGQRPTAERPPGAPDLAAVALGPGDVPPEILCEEGRYMRTMPPRITFRRALCPQGGAIGRTRLIGLSSQVSVFESELAAQASLQLTAQALLSAEGAERFAANFAATSGVVATDVRRRRVPLGARGVGLLTTFRTDAGRLAGFYGLVQSGPGLAELDAIGRAKGFDHRDLLPLLETIERRLGALD